MMAILAQIHYVPDHWKGKAHTTHVRDEFSMMYQYKSVSPSYRSVIIAYESLTFSLRSFK